MVRWLSHPKKNTEKKSHTHTKKTKQKKNSLLKEVKAIICHEQMFSVHLHTQNSINLPQCYSPSIKHIKERLHVHKTGKYSASFTGVMSAPVTFDQMRPLLCSTYGDG